MAAKNCEYFSGAVFKLCELRLHGNDFQICSHEGDGTKCKESPDFKQPRTRCKFCGARLKKDSIGLKCPTPNCEWQHGLPDDEPGSLNPDYEEADDEREV